MGHTVGTGDWWREMVMEKSCVWKVKLMMVYSSWWWSDWWRWESWWCCGREEWHGICPTIGSLAMPCPPWWGIYSHPLLYCFFLQATKDIQYRSLLQKCWLKKIKNKKLYYLKDRKETGICITPDKRVLERHSLVILVTWLLKPHCYRGRVLDLKGERSSTSELCRRGQLKPN